MKKLCLALALLVILFLLPTTASAAVQDAHLSCQLVFQSDGSCLVTQRLTAELTGQDSQIAFPLPANASVMADGSEGYTYTTEGQQQYLLVPVSGSGTQTLTVQYKLEGLLQKNGKEVLVTLPILSGFSYSLSNMDFSVTFPHAVTATPLLTGGYHQDASQILEYSVEENVIRGHSKVSLRDKETLKLEISVPKNMFRKDGLQLYRPDGWDLALLLLVLLAVGYFLLTLKPHILGRNPSCTPPEGITAGDVGTCLTGCGTDLTMLVLTWAQLGYITIELDRKNCVTLHKRMEMGNERSSYEARWFKILFGQHTMIDGDSYHYAKLCRKLAMKSPLQHQLYHRRSGNPLLLRAICIAAGMVEGVHLGVLLGNGATSDTLLAILMALICAALSWMIQSGGKCLPLREKRPLWIAVGCSVAWVVPGLLCGQAPRVVAMAVYQFVAGLAAAYGGKRSEMGQRMLGQMRGLRWHMLTASAFDLQQLLKNNPEYFYQLAPYALAMGVDRSFAWRFGKAQLPETNCLMGVNSRELTAAGYAARLRKVADILNRRQKQLPYEKLKR